MRLFPPTSCFQDCCRSCRCWRFRATESNLKQYNIVRIVSWDESQNQNKQAAKPIWALRVSISNAKKRAWCGEYLWSSGCAGLPRGIVGLACNTDTFMCHTPAQPHLTGKKGSGRACVKSVIFRVWCTAHSTVLHETLHHKRRACRSLFTHLTHVTPDNGDMGNVQHQ